MKRIINKIRNAKRIQREKVGIEHISTFLFKPILVCEHKNACTYCALSFRYYDVRGLNSTNWVSQNRLFPTVLSRILNICITYVYIILQLKQTVRHL